MPKKPSELILVLHNMMPAIIEYFDLVERVELAQTLLEATNGECEKVSVELRNTKAKIAEIEAERQRRHHLINDAAAKRLRDVSREIAERRMELESLQ
jgi:hypothetical protein